MTIPKTTLAKERLLEVEIKFNRKFAKFYKYY